jgi:hypothetical protein
MQWIIDHIAAVVIGGTIIFILAALNMRGQQASIETVQYHAARTAAVTLTSVMEQDIMNIGAGRIRLQSTDIAINKGGNPPYVEFRTRPDRSIPGTAMVRYTWEEEGEVVIDGEVVPTYQMKRTVDGQETPISGNIITSFDINLMRRFGDVWEMAPSPLHIHARRVDVSLTLVSPLGRGELMQETRWQRQILPVNLRRAGGHIQLQN